MAIRHLNQIELAARWNISHRTLERWRWTGEGPQFIKIGGRVAETAYLAERGAFTLNLRGDVPKQGGNLVLRLRWQAQTLSAQVVGGEIELAIRVAEPEQAATALAADLGGSPYVTGSPLEPQHGHSVFYGREELIGKISRQIATHGNVVLLEGNRRAGKTSILKHLEGRTAIPGWLAVYSSLQGAEGAAHVVGVPTAEVFREIARSIATAVVKLGIDVPLPNGHVIAAGKPALGVARACREGISGDSPFADFRDYLELVLSLLDPMGLGLVLMLDEFDKLQEGIDNGVTSPQVPENIRFLIQTYPKFSAVLTGSRRLKRLREEYWSALYGLGTSIPVTALDVESARKVITEPVREQLTFSQEAIGRVSHSHRDYAEHLEVTQGNPYQEIAEVLDLLVADGKKVLAIMDGFDKPLSNGQLTRNLWDQLRELALKPSLRLVTASRRTLRDLIRHPDAQTSDFWNIFDPAPVRVGCFDENDLSTILSTVPNLDLAGGARTELWNASNGFPVLTLGILNELCGSGVPGPVKGPWTDPPPLRQFDLVDANCVASGCLHLRVLSFGQV